jgi:hypothetical protein
VALARELLGGNGIVADFHVAKVFCDMEAIYTYEGTYEVRARRPQRSGRRWPPASLTPPAWPTRSPRHPATRSTSSPPPPSQVNVLVSGRGQTGINAIRAPARRG